MGKLKSSVNPQFKPKPRSSLLSCLASYFGTLFAVFLSILPSVLSDISDSRKMLISQFLMLSMPMVFITSFLATQVMAVLSLAYYQAE